jgi:hypothetical protein
MQYKCKFLAFRGVFCPSAFVGQPNVMKRERIMGYLEGTTSADTITMDERHIIIGNAMDDNCLECFFTICNSLSGNLITQSKPVQFTAPTSSNLIALIAKFVEHEHTPISQRWWHDPDHDKVGLFMHKQA